MHLVYFDESGNTGNNLTDPQQPILVMAALVVAEEKWQSLEGALRSLISNFFKQSIPEGFELHGAELRAGRGHFKGIPVTERIALRDDCMKLAAAFGLKFVYRAIVKSKYKAWHDKTFGATLTLNPCLPAYLLVANVVNSYLMGLKGEQRGIMVIDDNKEVAKDVEKAIQALRWIPDPIRLTHIVEKGFFIESHTSLPLQLCDIFTLWARKMEEDRIFGKATDGDRSCFPLIEAILHNGNGDWDVVEWMAKEMQKQK